MRPLGGTSGLTDEDALYRKVLLRLLPLLVIVYIIAYIDRSNVGFAKLGFMKDLGFTDTVFGIGAGVFYAGYMIFEIPSNLMLARIGFRKTLLRIMVLWAVCSALLAAMTSPNSYYFARFLLGAAEAGLFPGRCDRCVDGVVDTGLEGSVEERELQDDGRRAPLRIRGVGENNRSFGQRAGLVGAQDGHAAEVFDRVQAADDDALLAHGSRARRKCDAHDRR